MRRRSLLPQSTPSATRRKSTVRREREEMESVTSLVMCPDLVDSKDNVSCVLHNLATGQFSRILEQDLNKASIATVS